MREVMQQESGGRLYDANDALITSSVGAMGLMQVMPQTYDILRDWCKTGGQAATAVGGNESLAGWNFCPNSEPSVPL